MNTHKGVKLLWLWLITIMVIGRQPVNAEVLTVNDNSLHNLSGHLEIYQTEGNVANVQQLFTSTDFKPSATPVPNLDITDLTSWVRFTIVNNGAKEDLLLNYDYPIVDSATLYYMENGNLQQIVLGEHVSVFDRPYPSESFIYPVRIPQGEERTFLLALNNGQQIMAPLTIGAEVSILEARNQKDTLFGLYVGIMIAILVYNLFLFISNGNPSYGFYCVYILLVLLTQAIIQGYSYSYLWPGMPRLAEVSVAIISPLVGIASMLFMNHFLSVKEYYPKWRRGFWAIGFVYIICVLLFIVGQPQISYQLTQVTALVVSLYMLVLAAMIWRKGNKTAMYFLIAWSIFLTSVIIFVMKDVGALPYNDLTSRILEIGSGLEVLLLSFALADRLNILQREKEDAQEEAVDALKENERIITRQNIVLEEKVRERTKELNTTLNDLRSTQSQLVSAEKMASLGQLTAGIAHEINNPINFVKSNVLPLKRDIQDVLTIVEKYDEISKVNGNNDKFAKAHQLKEELDYELIKAEMFELLTGINDGAVRTAEIVKSLRVFSRLDEDVKKNADINDGLRSTVQIIGTNYKNQVEIKEIYEDIPQVDCFPGKLNQVFMNILNNAVQAAIMKPDVDERLVTISTSTKGDKVSISIKDNGTGMSEEVKNRIFEPFYTTKDVGEGTGLGLSIAYQIVEDHKGNIVVETEKGIGTEFIINLPIN